MDQRQKCIRDGLIVPEGNKAPVPLRDGVLYMDEQGHGKAVDHEGEFWTFVNETNQWEFASMTQDEDWAAWFDWAYGPQDDRAADAEETW